MRVLLYLLAALAAPLAAAEVEPVLKAPAASCFQPKQKFNNGFIGNWEIKEYGVRYSIRSRGKQVCLFARDVEHDEWFVISNPAWDGTALSASFKMLSTQWTTLSRLSLDGPDRIRDEYTTSEGKKLDYWTRRTE